MSDIANNICLQLMTLLLSSSSNTHLDYTPTEDERDGGIHKKKVVTLFGETEPISRKYYWNKISKTGHYPFDEKIGLVGRYCPTVVEETLRYACKNTYKEASKEFSHDHRFNLSPDVMRELVYSQQTIVNEFFKYDDGNSKEDLYKPIEIVYVLGDGTGVCLRPEHLRNVKGKKKKAKTREVKVGAIFIGSMSSKNEPHRVLDTTTYVATTHKKVKFGKCLRKEFDRRFSKKPILVIYITDGGKWLKSVHDSEFPFAIEILDIYHAIEHLEPLILGLGFKKGSSKYKRVYRVWKNKIKEGKIKTLLDSIEKKYKENLTGEARREFNYYRQNQDRMKYDIYSANGWFIGSGVIESGCKTIVCQRFKQSGMIWSLNGVKSLLPLRTLLMSNRLEEFFRYRKKHLEQVSFVS